MSNQDLGIFVCENCGNVGASNVPYDERPSESCWVCGADDWIFEPVDGLDARAKAAIVLGDDGMAELEDLGVTVVDARRLHALEALAEAAKAWRHLSMDGQYNEIPTAEELFEIVQAIGRASDSIRDAVDELEAMEREPTND